ncbi:hypothetical protein DF107_09175 [Burkholderia stagnalis]|nr:hypothetical protein DF161_20435 [Burkholderia stagnalis]RQR03981.1 hypothetical protein DF031_04560 [Burkholderia stagnalis]RQX93787.1 hypothetical protein DF120_10310 [Burkholderia stagnalis]RQY83023.1 hypothetical protein DF107_09175 [Burkholderia stagnalis]
MLTRELDRSPTDRERPMLALHYYVAVTAMQEKKGRKSSHYFVIQLHTIQLPSQSFGRFEKRVILQKIVAVLGSQVVQQVV